MSVKKDRLEYLIRREMDVCVGLPGGELSTAREALKNAYYGASYSVDADRAERGWSTYVDRSVMETIEWAKGPLLKVFAGTDELIRFEPTSPEEEQYARDATDYINKVVFGSHAFDLVYGPLTDGLYQRVGWAKIFFDESREKVVTGEFAGLTPEQAVEVTLQAQSGAGSEAEVTQDKDAETYNVTVRQILTNRQIRIEPLPSERVIYSQDAVSLEKARFVAHWEDRMAGELISEGYSRELVKSLPAENDDTYPEEAVQRRINADDTDKDTEDRRDGSRTIRIYEAYMTVDPKGDGNLQRLRVVYAGGKNKVAVLESEEWTMGRPPIFAAGSLPMPYSPVGLSLADLVLDLQKVRTEMYRNVLDNMYLANHGEAIIQKAPGTKVNMDQFLSRYAGGMYEIDGEAKVFPFPTTDISSSALAGLELTDKAKEQRTGIGMSNQGLSADVLQNTATGAAILEEAQNVRLEMIARVYAEMFYKPMAKYVLALAHKYMVEPVRIARRGGFADITPAEWNPEMGVTVAVGLGTGSRQKQAGSVQQILAAQQQIISNLGKNSFVRLSHVARSLHKLAESLGFESPEQYFGSIEDAQKAEQTLLQQPQPPNPEMLKIEMQRAQGEQKIQLEREKSQAQLQNDAAKMQADMAFRVAELEQKGMLSQRQMELEAELDAIKMATSLPKAGTTEISGEGTL